MNIKAIQAETERHAQIISKLIGQLKNHILLLPDNPRINRLNSKCFTISSKDLGSNWSAEHHDFKKQYNLIVKELEGSEPTNIFKKFQTIISEGKIVVRCSCGGQMTNSHTLTLHPDVVSNLRKLAGMPPTNCPNCHGEREWAGEGIKANCYFCGMTATK